MNLCSKIICHRLRLTFALRSSDASEDCGHRHWFSKKIPSLCECIDYNDMISCHVVAAKGLKGTSNSGLRHWPFMYKKFP